MHNIFTIKRNSPCHTFKLQGEFFIINTNKICLCLYLSLNLPVTVTLQHTMKKFQLPPPGVIESLIGKELYQQWNTLCSLYAKENSVGFMEKKNVTSLKPYENYSQKKYESSTIKLLLVMTANGLCSIYPIVRRYRTSPSNQKTPQ